MAGGIDLRSTIDGLIATGLDPDDVAAQVIDAVHTRRFSVLTHAGWSSLVTRRAERLVSGDQPELVLHAND